MEINVLHHFVIMFLWVVDNLVIQYRVVLLDHLTAPRGALDVVDVLNLFDYLDAFHDDEVVVLITEGDCEEAQYLGYERVWVPDQMSIVGREHLLEDFQLFSRNGFNYDF